MPVRAERTSSAWRTGLASSRQFFPHSDTMGFTRFLGNPPYRCFY